MGLYWAGHYQRLQHDPALGERIKTISVGVTPTEMCGYGQGAKEYLCLPKQYLAGFLLGINSNRIYEELREQTIRWQRKARLILYAVFTRGEDSAMKVIGQRHLRYGYDDVWIK